VAARRQSQVRLPPAPVTEAQVAAEAVAAMVADTMDDDFAGGGRRLAPTLGRTLPTIDRRAALASNPLAAAMPRRSSIVARETRRPSQLIADGRNVEVGPEVAAELAVMAGRARRRSSLVMATGGVAGLGGVPSQFGLSSSTIDEPARSPTSYAAALTATRRASVGRGTLGLESAAAAAAAAAGSPAGSLLSPLRGGGGGGGGNFSPRMPGMASPTVLALGGARATSITPDGVGTAPAVTMHPRSTKPPTPAAAAASAAAAAAAIARAERDGTDLLDLMEF